MIFYRTLVAGKQIAKNINILFKIDGLSLAQT